MILLIFTDTHHFHTITSNIAAFFMFKCIRILSQIIFFVEKIYSLYQNERIPKNHVSNLSFKYSMSQHTLPCTPPPPATHRKTIEDWFICLHGSLEFQKICLVVFSSSKKTTYCCRRRRLSVRPSVCRSWK